MVNKKGLKKTSLSNKAIYFLITLGIIALVAAGVYAAVPNPGHSAAQIDFSAGVNQELFSTCDASTCPGSSSTYGQTKLEMWGLYNPTGQIYIEPKTGTQLLIAPTDWSKNLLTSINGNVAIGGNLSANYISGTAFLYTSDRSLKTNISELQDALSKVEQLQGVSFNWKSDGRADVGLIAQDVEKVYPQLVSTNEVTGLKSVEYGNLVGVLVEAIKEQQKEIDDLKVKCG